MWISRQIEDIIRQRAASRPAVLLTGCRQSGKTSILKHLFPDYNYVTLDIPLNAASAEADGLGFIRRFGEPLIIDEVQYAPQLFRFLKVAIDSDRNIPGRFLVTGSQKFALMQGVSESLAGRVSVCDLHSLSMKELEDWRKEKIEGESLLNMMIHGGYPEIHARSIGPEEFYGDYLATYIERDVRQIINIKDFRDFDRFIRLLALRSGQILSMNSIASEVGVSSHTIKSWINILEISNIVYLLRPYYRNIGKRLVKSPKLYFMDTGLLIYLLGIRNPSDLEQSPLLGSIFETLAFGQLIRYYVNRGLREDLYFYRDNHGREIDFIIPRGDKVHTIECKWSADVLKTADVLQNMEKIFPPEMIVKKTVITSLRETLPVADNACTASCIDPGEFLDR